MANKIKVAISLVSGDIFIRCYLTRERFKEILFSFSDVSKKERGAGVTATIILGGILLTLLATAGTAIYGYLKVKNAVGTTVNGQQLGFLDSLIAGLGMGIVGITTALFNMAAGFLTTVIATQFVNQTITGNTTFAPVWGSVRNIADMIIVLGFVIVGIATALRIREYEAKSLLFKLIVVALLVNFSGLFCGIIIDAANITMTDLLKNGGANTSFTGLTQAVNGYVVGQLTGTPAAGTAATGGAGAVQ